MQCNNVSSSDEGAGRAIERRAGRGRVRARWGMAPRWRGTASEFGSGRRKFFSSFLATAKLAQKKFCKNFLVTAKLLLCFCSKLLAKPTTSQAGAR